MFDTRTMMVLGGFALAAGGCAWRSGAHPGINERGEVVSQAGEGKLPRDLISAERPKREPISPDQDSFSAATAGDTTANVEPQAAKDLPEETVSGRTQLNAAEQRVFGALVDELAVAQGMTEVAREELLSQIQQTPAPLRPMLHKQLRATLAKANGSAHDASAAEAADEPEEDATELPPPATRSQTGEIANANESEEVLDVEPESDQVELVSYDNEPAPDVASSEPNRKRRLAQSAKEPTATTKAASPFSSDAAWEETLSQTIMRLEAELVGDVELARRESLEARLRLLYLAAERQEDAARPIAGASRPKQEFWSRQMFGMGKLLGGETDDPAATSEALQHFDAARAKLGEEASLVIKNASFCTSVTSFGVLERFDRDAFEPGQQLLLYAEVDNFRAKSTEQGYYVALRVSYDLLDAQGRVVDQNEYPLTEEHCENARRDFFVRYFLRLPEDIYPGRYQLRLTVEDHLSERVSQTTLEFTVRRPRAADALTSDEAEDEVD